MRKKRTPEILWNSETVSRALDVCPARLMCLVRLELIPAPVILKDAALWRAADLRAWARSLGTADYSEATAALWAEWQDKTAAELRGEQ